MLFQVIVDSAASRGFLCFGLLSFAFAFDLFKEKNCFTPVFLKSFFLVFKACF